MAVIIGSARIDEHGRTTGGAAGDQNNGKEVSTQSWYRHSKNWRVFRARRKTVAVKIAECMGYSCANNDIGYDQSGRNTLWDNVKDKNYDPRKTTKKVETDCSALVRLCCAYAGVVLGNFTTSNEADVLTKSGQFVELKNTKYTAQSDYLRSGDILVTATKGHTAVVITDGSKAKNDTWKYNDESSAPVAPAETTTHSTAITVRAGTWFIRSSANKTAAMIGYVTQGVILHSTGKVNGWYHVFGKLANGKPFNDGWISEKAINKD